MVSLSEKAAEQIKKLLTDEGKSADNYYLRIAVKPGGCSGLSYKMHFDSQAQPADKVFEYHGCRLLIDNKSYLHIVGMTLDFSGGLNGKGFIFANPSASKTCGCGSSFAV